MAGEDVIVRADYRGAFAPDELDSLAGALRRAIPDAAVSIGIVYLQYYGLPRQDIVDLRVRFHFARPEPPAYVSQEATDAVLGWARAVWRRHAQMQEEPRPIVVTVVYYDRREDGAWQSEDLTKVILGRPDGEPKPFHGSFNAGPGARPEPPIWLYGPESENQRVG